MIKILTACQTQELYEKVQNGYQCTTEDILKLFDTLKYISKEYKKYKESLDIFMKVGSCECPLMNKCSIDIEVNSEECKNLRELWLKGFEL